MKENKVKCNFDVVFAKYDNVEELKEIANYIVQQVNESYMRRAKALMNQNEITVQVEVVQDEPKKKGAKKKSVASRAKEIAEKMKSEAKEAKKTTKKSVSKKEESEAEELIDIKDKKAVKKLGLTLEKYNEKCWVLRGNTKPIRKHLKNEMECIFNRYLTGGEGWLIRNSCLEEYAKILGIKVNVA